MANFDLRTFLTENKLTRVSKTLNEAAKKPTIKILKDLYYFDKLGSLGAKADVDEKYHSGAKLVFKKGKSVADDTTHDDSEYKMITSSKRLEKGVDYEVNESKLTRVSKTLIKENDQNQSSNPKLLAFIDGVDRQAIESYRMLGFKVEVDDPANDQYSAEMDFEGFDWMAVLSVLEDCEREGVEPFMTWNGNEYPFPEAMKLADEKAAEGMATGGMNESADSDEILEVINQLIEMGEEGQTALNILAKVPAWQAIVDRASDM